MISLSKLFSIFSKRQKINFFCLIFLSIINIFFEIISISLLVPLLSTLTEDKSFLNNFFENINFEFLNEMNFQDIIILLLLIYFIKFIFSLFFAYYKNNFYFLFQMDLMNKLFNEYIKRNYLFHVKSNSAKIIKDFLEEIHHVSIGFMGSVISVIIEVLLISSLIVFLLIFQTQYSIYVLVITSLISFFVFFVLKKKISNLGQNREKFNLINLMNINQALGGIKEIKIFQKEDEIINNFEVNSNNLKNTNWLISFYNETPKIFFELISLSSFLIILYIFVGLGYSFVQIISYFVIIFAIFIRIMPSINKLIVSYVNLTINHRALEIVYNELITNKNSTENILPSTKTKLNFEKEIRINNLSFKYDKNSDYIFKNINLEIYKGEILGIIGQTGSGKSTFLDLIIGLLKPSEGNILVDGKNIRENSVEWFKKIGYVPQNMYLNDDSIKKNIAFTYHDNKIDNDRILEVAEKSKINQMIKNKKDKLETRVGERGNMLSGGQKQRLSLARALYQNYAEVLIFDEFTSALDMGTENEIMNEIINFQKEKTIIMSTHRQNLLKYCDKIFNIETNEIILNEKK